ncbi:Enhancer of polycomb 1 [Hyphodiscus hymeniophilus]|uniref:Enhancer of polycomb-like protein n=1 Tax=Hyphodiscus hymeniophilus TaxID=353542 RepID=A0A9P7AWV0_9HELO|nr:Enhancer of polycomb 1 [Hyphodiscus hymeniophilus]
MAPPIRHTRVKKLNRSSGQQILREDQIEDYDSLALHTENKTDSGVEKSEEKEFHLQAALANSSNGQSEGEIPTRPAEETTDIDYDALYSLKSDKPATYIRFSQTVEECTGCQYDMSTEDDVFLTEYSKSHPESQHSEDVFERIMEIFEETQPEFAAVDQTLYSFDTMRQALKQNQMDDKLLVVAKDFYEFWKKRRQENGNHSLQPELKSETQPDNDDGDPYVCFRRREVRQTRKTRARDVQSTEKLKRLRKELEEGRSIVKLVLTREQAKRELMKTDKEIFDARGELKAIKFKTGIKTDDEELLINQKPQRRRTSEFQGISRQPASQLRMPPRADGRALDADLILLSDIQAQKENRLQIEIQEKSKQHEIWNSGFEDLTREPLSPVQQGSKTGFRPATAQYQLMTPPSSVTSESFDHPSPAQEKLEPFTFRYGSPAEEDEPRGQPAYRRRIGRCGRLWIDRRGMRPKESDDVVSDRFKFDQDDEEEPPVYEMDAFDTKALRFRATIPFPQHLIPQRVRPDSTPQVRGNGPSPPSNRSIAAAPQPAPT